MENETINAIKQDIEALDSDVAEAAQLLAIAQAAGENVAPLRAQYNTAVAKLKKWKDAIAKNGG